MDELGNYESSKLNDALTDLMGAGTSPINVRATVTRKDASGVSWAMVNGKEFPLQGTTVQAQPGEYVNVSYDGISAYSSGNYTDPSAGVQYVRTVEGIAVDAGKTARQAVESSAAARTVADEAAKVANATNQHFWPDDDGAHVTDVTQDEWKEAAADDFSDASDSKPYHNLLMNSLGILLRTALKNLVSITRSAIAFYDGTGNDASNIVARFGSDGAQIGAAGEPHAELDADSFNFVSGNSVPLVTMRIDPDNAQHWSATFTSDGTTSTYLVDDADRFEITPGTMTGYAVMIDGERTNKGAIQGITTGGVQYVTGVWFGPGSIPEAGSVIVLSVTAAARASLIVGSGKASVSPNTGNNTIIMGNGSFASGDNSIAAGYQAGAGGQASAAFGYSANANGDYSISAGLNAEATRTAGVAFGYNAWSHAQSAVAIGRNVRAESANQAVFGAYNAMDTNGDYALIVGNGTSDSARSNALAVTWDGDIVIPGAVNLANTLTTDTFTKSYTAAANSGSGAVDITITKTGYTPLGIVQCATGSQSVAIVQYSLLNDTTARMYFRNVSGSAASPTCNIKVLYMAVV